ncbi:hypothetical protein GCM10027168_25820 [Streptomyces capparidis]
MPTRPPSGALAVLAAALGGVLGLGVLAPPAAAAPPPADRTWTVTQPAPGTARDGAVAVSVTLDGATGALSLTARHGATTVLEPAPLGAVTDEADLTSGLTAVGRADRVVTERYTTTTGKRRERSALMRETRLAFAGRDGHRLDVVLRVADDGFAYRYVLPDGDGDGRVTVRREASAYRLPADATAWLMPYTVNYERPRVRTTAGDAAPGAYGHPSLFRVGGSHVLLTESDVDGRYSGSRLVHPAGTARYEVALADEQVTSTGPLATPWRTAVVGDLAEVTGSTLTDDLAPPSRIGDTSWIRPGRVAWSWLAGFGQAQRSLATQKRFVDFSAAHGWEYTLVDDGWKTTDWMPRLIEHATARGVRILLWVHWTDLDTAGEREELLTRFQRWGVAGVKIDFMDSDAQERYRWYDEVLEATAERRLLVNFHGSTIPHGIQRTWPHVMSMEAVWGAEQGNVGIGDITTLPFTRNVVGSMDYTPMGFQFGTRTTTEAAELALSVVYESGFQNYAGSVEAYRQRPELVRFLEQVPTVWDDTRLLSGGPGDEATFARRAGDRWFLGSVAAAGGERRVPLDFLGAGRWRVDVVRDGADGLERESRLVTRRDTLTVPTRDGGGFAALACRPRPDTLSCDRPVDRVPPTTLTVTPARAGADAGGTLEVTARLTVDEVGPVRDVTVAPEVPEGWTVRGEPARAAELAVGGELTARWTLTVPGDAPPGAVGIPVTARYRVPGGPALSNGETVRVSVSPPGVDYVSDLPFTAQRNGWGPVERDMSNGETGDGDGGPLRVGGTTYDKGLGVHAASEVTVALNGAYRRFTARVGVDDEVSRPGTVVFEVLADGELLARTGVLSLGDEAAVVDVDVTGAGELTLRVTDGGDGVDSDHADWADARLLQAG